MGSLHCKLPAELNAERASVLVVVEEPPRSPSRVETRSTGELLLLFEDWREVSVEDSSFIIELPVLTSL